MPQNTSDEYKLNYIRKKLFHLAYFSRERDQSSVSKLIALIITHPEPDQTLLTWVVHPALKANKNAYSEVNSAISDSVYELKIPLNLEDAFVYPND